MGWPLVCLVDCCTIKPPKSEARKLLKDNELVSFVPMRNLGVNTKEVIKDEDKMLSDVSGSYTYFAEKDVLLAKITPCFENGKLGVATGLTNQIGFGSSEFIVFRAGCDLFPEYLYYFLLQPSFRETGQAVMTGAVGHKRVPKDFIENTEIPLPPIPEQKRIVAILDQAFADIEQARALTEKNLKNARELFESYLQQVFSQRGEGWVETTLGNEIDLLTGFAFKSNGYVTHKESVPLIRGDNVIQGKLRWDGVKLWPKDKISDYQKYQLAENDIVLAMDRTWVKAGMKYSRITNKDLPALLVQRVARMRCLNSLNSDYLYHLVGSKLFENYVLSIQTGLGVPHISGKQIQDFKFSMPVIGHQKLVVETLNKLSKNVLQLTEIYQKKLALTDELKKSLLQKAFTGELTAKSAA